MSNFYYSAAAIANFFIDKNNSKATPTDLTHLKLQKLLYFAQGCYLANYNEPLFGDDIEAWRYGPVIPSIYKELRGSKAVISDHIMKKCIFTDSGLSMQAPSVNQEDARSIAFLDKFWDAFSNYQGWQLANATHSEGSPWRQVYTSCNNNIRENVIISNDAMLKYFKAQMASAANA